ncbi:DUF6491 family protein [Hyphomonas johnsonii]|uniref:Lipoprotein n=1 Tax=Hyphomonas johnsonii MHS-2 TaxID=1280950 RepID=A0A059FUB4_9PROT|nr:DUF6491 family protein [Hyphomonas johnsonii]KCZ94018.1 hypothetical protein HJO_01545 [Hyphomonas johnsonii MHS-2]
MRLTVIALSTIFLAACASQAPGDAKPKGVAQFAGDARLGEEVNKICFTSTIDGFHDATRDTVVLSKGNDDYLIEVYGNCFNLDQAEQLAVDSSLSCLNRGDHIITSDSISGFNNTSGLGVQRCTVKSMHKWDSRAKPAPEAEKSE